MFACSSVPARARARRAHYLLTASLFGILGFHVGVWAVQLAPLSAGLGLDPAALGTAVTVAAASGMVTLFAGGALANRVGRRPVLVIGFAGTGTAFVLLALADPGRGFDAVVIGEPQRAFYGNQYSLVMPVFAHYGVELWVPEVGGPIDPDSEAHDLIMSVFGGLSKGERNRIKLRVRAAMSAQAALEGRFLGGRPPYGYRLADAGPHPNPTVGACTSWNPTPAPRGWSSGSSPNTSPGAACSPSPKGSPVTESRPRPSTTGPATGTAAGKAGPSPPSAPS